MNVKDRNYAMQWLIKTYPLSFKLTDRRPLKLNISDDILAVENDTRPSKNALLDALNYYCQWGSYLNALKEGRERIDLDGKVAGVVTLAEQLKAESVLAEAAKKLNKST